MGRFPLWATGTQSSGDLREEVSNSLRAGATRGTEMCKVAWRAGEWLHLQGVPAGTPTAAALVMGRHPAPSFCDLKLSGRVSEFPLSLFSNITMLAHSTIINLQPALQTGMGILPSAPSLAIPDDCFFAFSFR